ncbi:hypothetical protein [Novosphingobium terrae]|uniref:hypothetical protein n=1 Tax=Novosphingobium terrae TaxID=2726189 RepID=UPI001980DE1B|nr:hypothetical protein [Novosphingobium terrae]
MRGIDRHPAEGVGATITVRSLALALLAVLGGMQLGLWAFLGLPVALLLGGAAALLLLILGLARLTGWRGSVSLGSWSIATFVALVILLLGGEGRWFYATPDWQVRYGVLRDLAGQPWPFIYPQGDLLRLPLGIYLAPALIGKLWGFHAAEQALLVQNTLLLGMLLALGGALFETTRQRGIALAFFWGFSGMDVLGQWIVGGSLRLHLESWAGLQFSSHITQAFWAPQHAFAGWLLALFFLLWRDGRLPLAVLLTSFPLVALLSPLALMGGAPLALSAVPQSFRHPMRDWALPFLATLLSLPALLYLTTASATVGAGTPHVPFKGYLLFITLEVGFYLLALWFTRRDPPFGRVSVIITVLSLLLAPLARVGSSADFTMRASIPALAILCLTMARIVIEPKRWPDGKLAQGCILMVWLIGLATPAGEIWRAVTWPAAPEVLCGYQGVIPSGANTYVAPLDRVPRSIRPPHPVIRMQADPAPCWRVPWRDPISGQASLHHPY